MDTWPFVSILTLNWNAKQTTLQWLAHLRNIEYPKDRLEIVIHDNASVDGSQSLLRSELEKMKSDGWRNLILIESLEHPGVTEAFNRAFARASKDAKNILRLDNDVAPKPDAVKVLAETMEMFPDAGIVGCQVVHNNPKIPDYGAIFINWWGGNHRIVRANSILECDAVLGCALMARRTLLDKIGFFFDPTLFFFQDEGDLCLRAKRLGYKVLYDPSAVVFHKAGTSSGKHPNLTTYLCVRNGIIFFKRYNRFPRKQVAYLRVILYSCKELLLRWNLLPLQAIMDGFREKPLSEKWWNEELAVKDAEVTS